MISRMLGLVGASGRQSGRQNRFGEVCDARSRWFTLSIT
jgi:hypothetical protein